jgi:hypothetical protein
LFEDVEVEFLHPKIWVFKNILTQSDDLINYLRGEEFSQKWMDWYTFGEKIFIPIGGGKFEKFPSQEEWDNQVTLEASKNKSVEEFTNAFYHITKKYTIAQDINLDNWEFGGSDLCYYKEMVGVSGTQAMNYHTDYQMERDYEPGNKFQTTCVFYLNDDYDGGEICFKIFEEDYSKVLERISYKPSKGDAVVFPSKHPVYHGVKIVESGTKYIIRSYWKYWKDGTEEYYQHKNSMSEQDFLSFLDTRHKNIWDEIVSRTHDSVTG